MGWASTSSTPDLFDFPPLTNQSTEGTFGAGIHYFASGYSPSPLQTAKKPHRDIRRRQRSYAARGSFRGDLTSRHLVSTATVAAGFVILLRCRTLVS